MHDSKCAQMTQWIEITVLELYKILIKEAEKNQNFEEEEICPICRCELYDDIMKLSKDELIKQNKEQIANPSGR